MAAWDNVEGFEFQHDLITPSLDRQATCLSMGKQFFGFSLHQVTHGASRDFSKRSSPAIHAAVQLLNKWENTTKEVNNYIHMIS